MLGGCSSINGMIYIRGNRYDYQRWYDAGNLDWHPSVVTQCFKKAESLQDQELLEDQRLRMFYGSKGPLVINTFNSTYRPLTEKILESWNKMGFTTVKDLNYAKVMGSGIFRATAYNGRRGSTDQVYLKPARNRSNLNVFTNSLVTKVLIREGTNEVYGVEISREGKTINVLASKEVILSAGSINTPQLLLLSGLGPIQHLKSKNITCLADLPEVGQNLQDHLIIPITMYGDEPDEINKAQEQFDVIKYLYNRTGYLAQNSFGDIVTFYSRNKWARYPEFQSHFQLFRKNSPDAPKWFESISNYKNNVADYLAQENSKKTMYLFLFNLLHPYSKGNISLSTSNPRDHPLIYPNYLHDARDIKATVDGIKMMTKIVNTEYFKSMNGHLGRVKWPECDDLKLDSDEYWKCIAINLVTTVYHPIGTAKMGMNSQNSVVNSELKVHLVKKLRVIDASVMPSHISGNINGPVIMIAERGSALIKREYGIKPEPKDGCF